MGGFDSLSTAINIAEATQQILAEDVAFADQELSDEVALGILLADTQTAEKYLQEKSFIANLDEADTLYRAYVKPRQWANGKARSSLGMPIVLEAIETILPTLYMSMFGSGKQPFALTPTGKTTPEAARAKTKILNWAIKQADLKEAMRLSLKTALQYGFVVGNWGWEEKEQIVKKYQMKQDGSGEVEAHKDTIYISQPRYDCMDLRNLLWDPGCKVQNLRKGAKFVIKQVFTDANGLDDLRDDPTYKNIPTREELARILAPGYEPATDSLQSNHSRTQHELQAAPASKQTSIDPLTQPLELLEYWSPDRVIVALQRKIIIRNEESEFTSLPFPSCAFIDVLGSAPGFGVAKLLSGEQRFQSGVMNSWIDGLQLILNPVFQLMKGLGAGTEQINVSPGKVVNVTGELKPLVVPSVSSEAQNAIASSEERANRRVGANSGANMPTQALRTAQGIQSYTGNVVERLQYFLEIFCDMIFVPVLEAFIEMCNDHMTPKQINAILTEVEGKEYAGNILDVYNATCGVTVAAGTQLAAKQAAAQLIPMIISLVTMQPVQNSLQIQNKKFDYAELLDEALELAGWDLDSLIVDMTPEDQKRAQEMNAAVAKGMADAQLQAQKHQDDLENIDAKGTVQAGVAIVKNIVKGHEEEAQKIMENMQGVEAPVGQ